MQVVLERVNSHVEISVADTGIGIRPEFLPHVFERFRQARRVDHAQARRPRASGCRSSSTWSSCTAARCAVDSAGEGQGATFTVHLPLAAVHRTASAGERVHPTAAPARTPTSCRASSPGSRCSSSTIEPMRASSSSAAARGLRRRGASPPATATKRSRSSRAQRPDVLVSDIGMPDVDGYELLKRVRALGPDRGGRIPAIALTAFARSEDRTRALRAGFRGPRVEAGRPVRAHRDRGQRRRSRRRPLFVNSGRKTALRSVDTLRVHLVGCLHKRLPPG